MQVQNHSPLIAVKVRAFTKQSIKAHKIQREQAATLHMF